MICPKCKKDTLVATSVTLHTEVGSISTICVNCGADFYTLIDVKDTDFVAYIEKKGGNEG